MASYRDLQNPDAVHFPGALTTRVLIFLVALLSVAGAAATIAVSDSFLEIIVDLLLILAVLVLAISAWPGEIVVDQTGLHYRGILWLRRKSIPWKRIRGVYLKSEYGQALARVLHLPSSAVFVEDAQSSVRIVHTSRHTDRQRFLDLLKVQGVRPDAESEPQNPDAHPAAIA